MPYEMFTGYLLDEERPLRDAFLRTAVSADVGLAGVEEIPDKVDSDWARVEQQARMNSCGGHASSSSAEAIAHWMGESVHFSRMLAYLFGQERSGIKGDRGVYIKGLVEAFKLDGFAHEDKFPYPQSYHSHIPDDVRAAAQLIKGLKHYEVSDSFTACKHIALKRPILMGIPWKESFARERDRAITDVSGRTLGGHAVCCIAYEKIDNEWWPELFNSHGSQWAEAGRSMIEPRVFKWMLENGVVVALEGLTGIESGVVDFTDPANNPFHRGDS